MIIVYQSNTGFSLQYAQMLGQAEKLKVFSLDEAKGNVSSQEEVFFFGGLTAGHINGLDRARKSFHVVAVCGVGMSAPSMSVLTTMSKANYLSGTEVFYLQGGWAPEKVGWFKRRMVGMVTRSTRKALEAKGSRRTKEEEAQLAFLVRGGSMVAFEHLRPIREWLSLR